MNESGNRERRQVRIEIDPRYATEVLLPPSATDMVQAEELGRQIHNAMDGKPSQATADQVEEFVKGMQAAKAGGDTDFT